MLRSYLRVLFLLGAGLLSGAAIASDGSGTKPATGSHSPGSAILVVDVQRVLDESLAAKSVQKQIETYRSKFQTDIGKEENDLRQAEQGLNKAHEKLTAETYADQEQQLRQRFLTVERHVQARRKVLDEAFSESMNAVRAGLLDTVSQVGHERGADMVLTKQQVVWTDKAIDVTDEVLARLNTKLPRVTVKMEPEEKGAASPK